MTVLCTMRILHGVEVFSLHRVCVLCAIVLRANLFLLQFCFLLRRFTPTFYTPLYAVSRETALLCAKYVSAKNTSPGICNIAACLFAIFVSHETILKLPCKSSQMFHVKHSCASHSVFYWMAQLCMQNLSISPVTAQIGEKFAIFLVFPQKISIFVLTFLARLAIIEVRILFWKGRCTFG